MRLYRLAKAQYAASELDEHAIGAKRVGGRWNSAGVPVVYTSRTVGAAALEVLVHVTWDQAPAFKLVAIDTPDDVVVSVIELEHLPSGWDQIPAPEFLAEMGDEWVASADSLLLEVPSVASPYERNLILNPAHPDAARCKVSVIGDYIFDPRLRV